MKFKAGILFGICTSLLLSCNSKKNVNIETNKSTKGINEICKIDNPIIIDKTIQSIEEIDINDIAKVSYIKMETNKDCLFPRKWSFSGIYMNEQNMFISFGNNILRFDSKGSFLNCIGKMGGAPFEFSNGGIFSINEPTKEIFLLDYAKQRTLIYEYDGKFKRSFKNESYFDRFYVLNDSIAICSNNDITIEDRAFTISLIDGNKRDVLLGNKRMNVKNLMVNIGAFSRTNKELNNIYLCIGTSDTIFTYDINKKRLKPAYIQFPANIDEDEIKTVPYLQFETSSFASILINDRPMPNFTFWFDKKKGNLSKVRIKNRYLNDYVLAWGTNVSNIVIDILEMPKLKELYKKNNLTGELKLLVEKSNEEDNPIIMIAEITK